MIRSSSFNKNLMYWFTYDSDTDGHPLDGQMDSSIDYESKVVYRFGMAQWDYSDSERLGEQKAKEYFFHILATIDKLEGFKHQRKGAYLDYLDACAVMHFLDNTIRNRPETLPSSDQAISGALYATGKKILCAIQKGKGTKLTRDELQQVLVVLQRISRPKPKSRKESPKELQVRELLTGFQYARGYDPEPETDDERVCQDILRNLGHAPINGADYTVADWGVVAQTAVDDIKLARKKGGSYKLIGIAALKLHIAMSIMYALIERENSDVELATFSKMLDLFHENHTLKILEPDDVAYLDRLFEDIPAAVSNIALYGVRGRAFSIPPSMSKQEAMEFDIANFRNELFSDNNANNLICEIHQPFPPLPEHVGELARILRCAKATRESIALTLDQAWDIMLTLRIMFQYNRFVLIEPTLDTKHPQITAINKLLGLVMTRKGTEKVELTEFDFHEVCSLSLILDQLPGTKTTYTQDKSSVSIGDTKNSKNEQDSAKPTSHILPAADAPLSLLSNFEFRFGDTYTPPITKQFPIASRAIGENKKSLHSSKLYSEGDLDSIIATGTWALQRNFAKYARDPLILQEEWEFSIGMPQVNQIARARYVMTLLGAETSMMIRQHHNDLGVLGKRHESAVEKFDQQIANAKAEAEVKLNEIEARYKDADAKYNKLRADHGHAKEEAIRQFNKSKAEIEKMHLKATEDEEIIKKLKENGRGEIQRSRDRAERYKSKYDEEVKNNSVMKLDYKAMSQMIEEMKVARKIRPRPLKLIS